jgi:hypothetical protein
VYCITVATSFGLLKNYERNNQPLPGRIRDDVIKTSLNLAEIFIDLGADVNEEDKKGKI